MINPLLADLCFDSDKKYHAADQKFTTWLVEQAGRCGYDTRRVLSVSDAAPSQNQRSTARTKKQKSRDQPSERSHLVSVDSLLVLAKAIASSLKPIIPRTAFNLLTDVIFYRKEVRDIYGDGDTGHAHIIEVLEKVRKIFRPLLDKTGERSPPKSVERDATDLVKELQIEELEVEDLEPEAPASVSIHHSPAESLSMCKDQRQAPSLKYRIDWQDDAWVTAMLFLRDFNIIREHLRQVWTRYVDRELSLTTAVLVTNTGVELMRKNCAAQLGKIEGKPGVPPGPHFINWIYTTICENKKFPPLYSDTTSDDVQSEIYHVAEMVGYNALELTDVAMRPLRATSFSFPATDALADADSAAQKILKDLTLVQVLFSDLHNATVANITVPSSLDYFSRLFFTQEISLRGRTPMAMVFALQIHLDIQHVLGKDAHRPFDDLVAAGDRTVEAIQRYFQFTRTIEVRCPWHDGSDPGMLQMVSFISRWLKKDVLNEAIDKNLASKNSLSILGSRNSSVSHSLLKHHPLLCGSILFWMQQERQDFGLKLTNSYNSIMGVSHLYNASKQMGFIDIEWPDMDFLHSVHGKERIFVGDFPTNPADFYKRWQMVMGANVVRFAKNRRAVKNQASHRNRLQPKDPEKRRILCENLPIYEIFFGRYCRFDPDANLSSANLDAVIGTIVSRHPDDPEVASLAQQWTKTRKLSSVQVLSILTTALADEDLHLEYDYFAMHARCARLLSDIRRRFIDEADGDSKMRVPVAGGSIPLSVYVEDNWMPLRVPLNETVASIFMADPAAAEIAQVSDREALAGLIALRQANVSLERAAKWIREVVEREGNVEMTKARAGFPARPVDSVGVQEIGKQIPETE